MAKDPYKYFRIEARELTDSLAQGILALESAADRDENILRLLRHAHTLKGASRVVRQPEIADVAHAMEDVLARRQQEASTDTGDFDSATGPLLAMVDAINARLRLLDAPPPASTGRATTEEAAVPNPTSKMAPSESSDSQNPAQNALPDLPPGSRDMPHSGPDPLDDTVRIDSADLEALSRAVSALRVEMNPLRREASIANTSGARAIFGRQISERQFSERQFSERQFSERQATASVRGGPHAAPAFLGPLQDSATGVREQNLDDALHRMDVVLDDIQARVDGLRLVRVDSIFQLLERATRDAGDTLGRRVRFRASGGDARLSAPVLRTLRDALLHAVRNAVAHGIEKPEERVQAGKHPTGALSLTVVRRFDAVVLTLWDDGRGVDTAAVRTEMTKRGLVSEVDAMRLTDEQVLETLLKGRLSTAGAVDQVSGRGIGLDAVRAAASTLKGRVSLRSRTGEGTALELMIPLSTASLRLLEVESENASAVVGVPMGALQATMRVRPDDVKRTPQGDLLTHEGLPIVYLSLETLSGGNRQRNRQHVRASTAPGRKSYSNGVNSALILRVGEGYLALGIGRILGQIEGVVKPLPPLAGRVMGISGAYFSRDGSPRLVIDAASLVESVAKLTPTSDVSGSNFPEKVSAENGEAVPFGARAPRGPASDSPLPVLVIDDSLTTRMLERTILETAGFEVDVAVSGEEGLERARQREYAIFIVDVEMPGMDGFEFIRTTREEELLRDTPAILVTSRFSSEDRLRGERVGARAHIQKSAFNESTFLDTIRSLVGG